MNVKVILIGMFIALYKTRISVYLRGNASFQTEQLKKQYHNKGARQNEQKSTDC